MDRSPKVSVIIATFNRSAYLRQSVASVLVQTFPSYEIVVVDDGSSDNTAAVVAEFGDERVKYIRQDHSGRSSARNQGLRQARGEFIAFLDDDDLYLPGKLSLQSAFLETHPSIDLLGAGTQVIDEQGRVRRVWRTWESQPELRLPACLYACPLPTCTVLLRRRALDLVDQWFDPDLDRAEDTDFFLRLLLADCRMMWLPEIVSAYRLHPASSQHDGARYGQSYRRLLDKLYARPDLPPDIAAERDKLYAHYSLVGACHAYASGQIEEARADLARAVALRPDLVMGHPSLLAATVAAFARSHIISEPHCFIDCVFGALPPELIRLRALRASAHSAYHMQQVFRAHKGAERLPLQHWLRGVISDPRWLLNRGVWSALRDALLPASMGSN